MSKELVLINHIQDYIDSGKYQYEACYLNKEDLNLIIKALEKKNLLSKIRAEIEKQEKWLLQVGCNTYNVDIALDVIKSTLTDSEVKKT